MRHVRREFTARGARGARGRFEGALDATETKPGVWRLNEPLVYRARDGRRWIVPAGFWTNLYSIPEAIKWLFGEVDAEYGAGAALHDWLYEMHESLGISRAEADGLLREATEALGMSGVKRGVIYAGVRVFGGRRWEACEGDGQAMAG